MVLDFSRIILGNIYFWWPDKSIIDNYWNYWWINEVSLINTTKEAMGQQLNCVIIYTLFSSSAIMVCHRQDSDKTAGKKRSKSRITISLKILKQCKEEPLRSKFEQFLPKLIQGLISVMVSKQISMINKQINIKLYLGRYKLIQCICFLRSLL